MSLIKETSEEKQAETLINSISTLRAKKEEVIEVYRELNYLFTFENFREDSYLMQSMRPDLSIPLTKLQEHKNIKEITLNQTSMKEAIMMCPTLIYVPENDKHEEAVRPNIKLKRDTLIIRDVPLEVVPSQIRDLCKERVKVLTKIRRELVDTWLITFETEEAAMFAWKSLQGCKINDHEITAELKSDTLLRGFQTQKNTDLNPEEDNMSISIKMSKKESTFIPISALKKDIFKSRFVRMFYGKEKLLQIFNKIQQKNSIGSLINENQTEKTLECPCLRNQSNITFENQEIKSNELVSLPESVLLENNETMKIRGLKISSLGKKWQNNPLQKYETEEANEFASNYSSAVSNLFAYFKHSDNPRKNRDTKTEKFNTAINTLFKSAQKAGNLATDEEHKNQQTKNTRAKTAQAQKNSKFYNNYQPYKNYQSYKNYYNNEQGYNRNYYGNYYGNYYNKYHQ